MRQQLKPQYRENGAVYVMRADKFMGIKNRFFGKTVLYITPSNRTLEIDEPEDLEYAAFKTKHLWSTNSKNNLILFKKINKNIFI